MRGRAPRDFRQISRQTPRSVTSLTRSALARYRRYLTAASIPRALDERMQNCSSSADPDRIIYITRRHRADFDAAFSARSSYFRYEIHNCAVQPPRPDALITNGSLDGISVPRERARVPRGTMNCHQSCNPSLSNRVSRFLRGMP